MRTTRLATLALVALGCTREPSSPPSAVTTVLGPVPPGNALFAFSENMYTGDELVVEAHDKSADHVRISVEVPFGAIKLHQIELRIDDLKGTPRVAARVAFPTREFTAHSGPYERFEQFEFVDVDYGRIIIDRRRANPHPEAVIDLVRIDFALFASREYEHGTSSVRYAGHIECRVL